MAGVFISYRRSDSAGHTGRLASDLAEGLDEQQHPTKPPVAAGTRPTTAGIELVGKATVDGPALEATLVDSFSNDTETLILMLSEDGQTMEGTVHSSANPDQEKIVLRRL